MTKKKPCPQCGKEFKTETWRNQKFCSVQCGVDFHRGTTLKKQKCIYCNREFKIEPWKHHKYCSIECAHMASRGITYENRQCLHCGETFQAQPFKTNKYCSRKCWGLAVKKTSGNTRKTHAPQSGNGQYLHRLIMEKQIGRELLPTERIHHVDMDKFNNSLNNLYLFYDESEHQRGHKSLERLTSSLIKDEIIKFCDGRYILNEKM